MIEKTAWDVRKYPEKFAMMVIAHMNQQKVEE